MPVITNYFRMDGWVKSAQGPAIPGAQIYVCTQPANTVALPPSPLANIFSDVNGLVPITQPIITDGFGHYDFYAQAAVYTIVVGLGGAVQEVYPDQSLGGASGTSGGGGGTALVIQVNGVSPANQLLLNLQGAGSTSVTTDGNGNITIAGASSSFGGNGAFFYGPALTEHPFDLTNLAVISTCVLNGSFVSAGTVILYLFQMLDEFTISQCSEQANDNFAGHTSAFGIYDINGNLVVDGGSFNSLTSPIVQTNSFSPVTLNPGLYWHAQVCNRTETSAGFTGISMNPGSVFGYIANTFTKNAVRCATAANLAIDGPNNPQGNPTTVLPATLGALTPFTPQGTVDGVCIPLWE